jgi:hypothetical protein
MDKPVIKQMPYNPDQPGELYLIVKKERDFNGPPDSYQVKVQVDWQNFMNPMDILNALEVTKGVVVQTMMQQQQAMVNQNPNMKRPPWVKDRN